MSIHKKVDLNQFDLKKKTSLIQALRNAYHAPTKEARNEKHALMRIWLGHIIYR